MPIAPWNPGGYYPFTYGAPAQTSSNPLQGTITPDRASARSLPGGPVSGYAPAFGGVPTVPNPGATQQDVMAGNLGTLGSLYNLATGVGSASAAGAGTQVAQNLPGFTGMTATSSGNIESLLQGNIPDDVKRQLYQAAAERGVSIGSPDSPNSDTALLRLLGNTSLGLQTQGEQELTGAIGRTPTGPAFNPASMLVDPNQQQMAQLLANYLAAAPNPSAAAAANLQSLLGGVGAARGAVGGGGGGGSGGVVPASNPAATSALGFGFGSYGTGAAAPSVNAPAPLNATTIGAGQLMSPQYPSAIGPNPYDAAQFSQYAQSIGPQNQPGYVDPSLGPSGGDPMMSQQFDFSDPNWWNSLIGSGDEMNFGG